MTDWIPPHMQKLAAEVERETGVKPALERTSGQVWTMTIATERVKNVITYKRTAGGRMIPFKDSRLWIDGEERRPLRDKEEFYELLLYPDEWKAKRLTLAAENPMPEMPPLVTDYETLPVPIKREVKALLKGVSEPDVTVKVGGMEDVYAVHIIRNTGHPLEIRLTYERANGLWYYLEPLVKLQGRLVLMSDLPEADQLFIEGIRSKSYLSGQQEQRPDISAPRGVQGKAESVKVRNTTVIRN